MSGLVTLKQHTSHPSAPPVDSEHLYFYSDGKLYRMLSDGIASEVGAGGGGSSPVTVVTLGADVTNNNAVADTLQDATGLSFAVTSGTMYRFMAHIAYTISGAGFGSRWTLNGPALTRGGWMVTTALTAGGAATTNFQNAYNSGVVSSSSPGTDNNLATVEGYVLPSASGTLIVRFSSEGASTSLTAKAGSTIVYW